MRGTLLRLEDLLHVADVEIIVLGRLKVVPLPQQSLHLILKFGGTPILRLDQNLPHRSRIGLAAPNYLLLRGAHRHQNHIVLVLAGRRLPLRHQRPHHGEGNLLDANNLANRIFTVEKVVHHGLAEQRHPRRPLDVAIGERCALVDRQIPDRQVVGRGAQNLGAPVVVAKHGLGPTPDGGCRQCGGVAFEADSKSVVHRQRLGVSSSHVHSRCGDRPRQDDDEVAADRRNLLLYPGFRPRTHRDHGDHGRNADNDPQHGQRRAHPVDLEGAQGDPDAGPNLS